MVRIVLIAVTLWTGLDSVLAQAAARLDEIRALIEEGHWQKAHSEIAQRLQRPGLTFLDRQALLFEQERMRRIGLDFPKTRADVLVEARQVVPGLDEQLFARWERAGAVEFFNIDGQRHYFDLAAANLFRVNPEAKALQRQHQPAQAPVPPHRLANLRQVLSTFDRTGQRINTPKTLRITYRLTVKAGAVPPGETIRAWLPYPHAAERQVLVQWVTNDPPLYVLSPTNAALASVYLEKPALAGQPTTFLVVFDYTTRGAYQLIDPQRVRPVPANDPALAPFLAERPPHLVFDDTIRALSREIVAEETNPYLKARRIYQWIDRHIPWANAREYSTLESLPRYALVHRHGDCGIQTMLLITLCRLNGIPARWISGWMTGPDKNMHDWAEVYFEPYGWVPADAAYGLVPSPNQREHWFFLGGIDSYRLVVNTDYDQPLYPAKSHERSELVDFQRGEVEWRGGNLYFDQWSYNFRVEELTGSNP